MTKVRLACEAPVANRLQALIAILASLSITCHIVLRFAIRAEGTALGLQFVDLPLIVALAMCGVPLVLELLLKLLRREFGSDLLAGISIVTSVLLGEYLAGALVVLMLSGGGALESYVGIAEVRAGQTPEQKLEIVRAETRQANTVFLGDGINDAPALTAATVGIAFGQNSEVTSEAAGAVILESSLERVDEFLHISGRLRTIALQSAVGGMVQSLFGMIVAAAGYLPPVAGAIFQEVIDVAAVVNALRMAIPPRSLTDY